jgi:O-antigen ligase
MSSVAATADKTALPEAANRRVWRLLFLVTLLTTNIQFSLTFSLGGRGELRWLHLVYPLVAFLGIMDLRDIRMNAVWRFFLVALFFNVVAYIRFGFSLAQNFRIEVLFFAMMFYYVGTVFARRIDYPTTLATMRRFGLLLLAVILMRDLFWAASYGFNLYGNPVLEESTFIVGGLNSEGQWLAQMVGLYLGSAAFLPASAMLLVISQVSSSRSTLLLWGLGVLFAFIAYMRRHRRYFVPIMVIGGLLAFAGIVVANNLDLPIFKRFSSIGGANDLSTAGRAIVVIAGIVLLSRNLWGYGIGNVMPRIYDAWSGVSLLKPGLDNTENLYLQITLEAGIIALLFYFLFILSASRIAWRNRKYSPLFLPMLLFWVSQTLGGGGGNDPTFWLIAGLFFGYTEKHDSQKDQRKRPLDPAVR